MKLHHCYPKRFFCWPGRKWRCRTCGQRWVYNVVWFDDPAKLRSSWMLAWERVPKGRK